MDELMLDGNAIGGLLQEVFAVEMTTAVGTCGDCGAPGPVGAVRVYRGAGIVLRCPQCSNTLAKIVKGDSRVWIDLTGIRVLELTVRTTPSPALGADQPNWSSNGRPSTRALLPGPFARGGRI
jgi:hypothetical protein